MLTFRNGRFYAMGVSFVIPDGFHLDAQEVCTSNGLVLYSPDEEWRLEVIIYKKTEETDTWLRELLSPDEEHHIIKDVSAIQLAGLQGHEAVLGKTIISYEARLDTGVGSLVSILICDYADEIAAKGLDIITEAHDLITKLQIQVPVVEENKAQE